MEPANPYRASDLPVEQLGDVDALPTTSYVSAGCSGMFVFVGGTAVLMFLWEVLRVPLGIALIIAPSAALFLAVVSGWETLRLERKKRRERLAAAEAAAAAPLDAIISESPPGEP